MADISKDEAIELARAAGVVDGPKILMMATPDELHRLAQAAFKLGRNAGLEEAEHKYEIETLRAQLAALHSDDELPEPVGCGYVVKWSTGDTPSLYMEGYANVIGADVYTANQLRQAQAMVRAKMVPLEKDAARLDWYEANATHVISVVGTWYSRAGYLLPMTKRKSLRAAIDDAMGSTGEPK